MFISMPIYQHDKLEFVEPQKLIKHTIFTRKNDVNDA